jgi:oxygen-independent coproporphyrinogen-3 oxidase
MHNAQLTTSPAGFPLGQGENSECDQAAGDETMWVDVIRSVEVLSEDERFNELVFTALRTKIGVDLVELRVRFGDKRSDKLLRQAQKYINSGRMKVENNRLSLTRAGIYISDAIISDFMIV